MRYSKHFPYLVTSSQLLIVMCFNMSLMYGQNFTGTILDQNTQEPLENVSVFITHNSKNGTTTDALGQFNLQIKSRVLETDSISFSILGYTTYKTTLASLKDRATTIYLSNSSIFLNQVTVQTEKKQSKIKFNKVTTFGNGSYGFASTIVKGKLYISGGDQTVFEDSFKEALAKASMNVMELSWADIQKDWQPNGSHKGYSDKLLVYDIETNTWINSDVKLENRAYHQINYYNNNLYILGGKKIAHTKGTEYLHNIIERYNIDEVTVQVDNANPHQAINFAAFIYKDNLITMGGAMALKKNGDKVFTDKISVFNLKTGLWYDLGKLKQPKEVSGVLIGDKIYIIGDYTNQSMSSIESWNVNTGAWEVEGELFYTLDKAALTSYGNTIYIYHYGKLLTYDSVQKSLKEYPIGLYLNASKLHIYKDKLYIIGGYKETIYSKKPTSGIYSIQLSEFYNTKATGIKNMP